VHLSSSMSSTQLPYLAASETALLPPFSLADGVAADVAGAFGNHARTGAVHFRIWRGIWAALRGAVHPSIPAASFGLWVAAQPGSPDGTLISTIAQPDVVRASIPGEPEDDIDLGENDLRPPRAGVG